MARILETAFAVEVEISPVRGVKGVLVAWMS